jgi:homoserine dehydrogenase
MKPLRIGIAGLGTVGVGVAEILQNHGEKLVRRAGRELQLVAVSSRTQAKERGLKLQGVEWVEDVMQLAHHPQIDAVVELIGGAEGVAKQLVQTALQNGKHVITANKALIAHHGVELAQIAENLSVQLQFEAAVAGGIPIIKLIKEGLAANDYQRLIGILNGTCNYILSTMEQTGRGFAEVLAEAQALGYAEADPAFDIDGIDAAHKLCILSAIAFGTYPAISQIYCEGIREITAEDIAAARALGYTIRLIATTAKREGGIELRVHPALLALGTPVSEVDGVYNAVHLFADSVGDVFIEGRGAGRYPTASAVVADIIDVARGNAVHPFLTNVASLTPATILPMNQHLCAYYLRLQVSDNSGVLASITKCFSDAGVSIARLIQQERNSSADITLTTHLTKEANMNKAISAMQELDNILLSPARLIRIEQS